jgi:hypothetical protein
MSYNVPGEKKKGGGYKDKNCLGCGARLTPRDAVLEDLISETKHFPYTVPYVDGRGLIHRYDAPPHRFLRKDLSPLLPKLKQDELYAGPKVLIRQAGVGVVATLVDDDSRCPQSVYIYRVTDEAKREGYSNEFILACLVSRTMNFVVMKRFAEIDPAKAFAKLTHARIQALPIPKLTGSDTKTGSDAKIIAAEIRVLVREMLTRRQFGSPTDHRIESLLRELWGITPDEGRYVNGFFSSLPDAQAVQDLFPEGAPTPVPPPGAI